MDKKIIEALKRMKNDAIKIIDEAAEDPLDAVRHSSEHMAIMKVYARAIKAEAEKLLKEELK